MMFQKVIENRVLIIQTTYLYLKYMALRYLLTNKGFLSCVSKKEKLTVFKSPNKKVVTDFPSLIKTTDKILYFINPKGNCLVNSLVKRSILQKFGYIESIVLGVRSTETGLKAHAWLHYETSPDYNILYYI